MINDILCKDGRWHAYENIIEDTPDLILEQCVACGHKIQFNKVEGRIDNERYLKTHMLWFVQPNHPQYQRYYGQQKPNIPKHGKALAADNQRDMNEIIKEEKKFAKTQYYT